MSNLSKITKEYETTNSAFVAGFFISSTIIGIIGSSIALRDNLQTLSYLLIFSLFMVFFGFWFGGFKDTFTVLFINEKTKSLYIQTVIPLLISVLLVAVLF